MTYVSNCPRVTKAVLTAAMILGSSFDPGPISARNNPLETDVLVRQLMNRLSDADKKGVLVLDLKTSDDQWLDFGGWIADRLSSSLADQKLEVEVIDRSRLATALKELQRSCADEFNIKNQLALGKALGANTLVVGSYGAMDNEIGVTLAAFRMAERGANLMLVTGKIPLTQEVGSHLTVSLDSLRPKD